MYFVLGWDNGLLMLMTSREFATLDEAVAYRDNVRQSYRAFIVTSKV